MLRVELMVPVHGHGLQPFAVEVPGGSVLALFGPSGSGKTTLLRALAGLHPSAGPILWDAKNLAPLPVHERPLGFVPQEPSLFPHWTLRRQIVEARSSRADDGQVEELTRALGLRDLLDRPPRALSGGQQQRGALARALAREPRLLLLDEPFSALDGPTRLEIGHWLRSRVRQQGLSMVMASHDWSDVEAWSDRVCLLDSGQVVGEGAPGDLFLAPPSWTAARLLGYEVYRDGRALHPDLAEFERPAACSVVVAGRIEAVARAGPAWRARIVTNDGLSVSATGRREMPPPLLGARTEVGFYAPEVPHE